MSVDYLSPAVKSWSTAMLFPDYHICQQMSSVGRNKSQQLNVSRFGMQYYLPNKMLSRE